MHVDFFLKLHPGLIVYPDLDDAAVLSLTLVAMTCQPHSHDPTLRF